MAKYTVQEAMTAIDNDLGLIWGEIDFLRERVKKLERELETERRLRLAMKGR